MAQNYQLQKTGQEIDDLLQKIDDLGPASSGSAGTMSAQDKAKLDDIETGAESNVIEGIVLGETSLTPSASKTVTIPVDSAPTEGSENPVASGGVYDALNGKMDKDTSAGENDIAVFNDEGQVVGAFDVNEVVREGRIKQTTGQSTTDLMSQKAVTDALDTKAAKDEDAVEGNLAKFDSNGNPVDAGIAAEKINQLGQKVIYDVTANNSGATFASLSALLSSENLSTLIPTAVRCGGMSIRFVRSSDNNYIQFRYMSSSTAVADITNVSNWQGVDTEITDDSKNFVTSGGISEGLTKIDIKIGYDTLCYVHKGILRPDGSYGDTDTYWCKTTDKIPCQHGEKFYYKGNSSANGVAYLLFDASNTIIDSGSIGNDLRFTEYVINNANAASIVFSSFARSVADIDFEVYSENSARAKIDAISGDVQVITNQTKHSLGLDDGVEYYINSSSFISGYYLHPSAQEIYPTSNTSYGIMYINVKKGDVVVAKLASNSAIATIGFAASSNAKSYNIGCKYNDYYDDTTTPKTFRYDVEEDGRVVICTTNIEASNTSIIVYSIDKFSNTVSNFEHKLQIKNSEITEKFILGKNLFDRSRMVSGYNYIETNGQIVADPLNGRVVYDFIRIDGGQTYTFSMVRGSLTVHFYDKSESHLGNPVTITSTAPSTFITPNDAYYVRFVLNSDYVLSQPMLELGSQKTEYEPFGYKLPSLALGECSNIKHRLLLVGLQGNSNTNRVEEDLFKCGFLCSICSLETFVANHNVIMEDYDAILIPMNISYESSLTPADVYDALYEHKEKKIIFLGTPYSYNSYNLGIKKLGYEGRPLDPSKSANYRSIATFYDENLTVSFVQITSPNLTVIANEGSTLVNTGLQILGSVQPIVGISGGSEGVVYPAKIEYDNSTYYPAFVKDNIAVIFDCGLSYESAGGNIEYSAGWRYIDYSKLLMQMFNIEHRDRIAMDSVYGKRMVGIGVDGDTTDDFTASHNLISAVAEKYILEFGFRTKALTDSLADRYRYLKNKFPNLEFASHTYSHYGDDSLRKSVIREEHIVDDKGFVAVDCGSLTRITEVVDSQDNTFTITRNNDMGHALPTSMQCNIPTDQYDNSGLGIIKFNLDKVGETVYVTYTYLDDTLEAYGSIKDLESKGIATDKAVYLTIGGTSVNGVTYEMCANEDISLCDYVDFPSFRDVYIAEQLSKPIPPIMAITMFGDGSYGSAMTDANITRRNGVSEFQNTEMPNCVAYCKQKELPYITYFHDFIISTTQPNGVWLDPTRSNYKQATAAETVAFLQENLYKFMMDYINSHDTVQFMTRGDVVRRYTNMNKYLSYDVIRKNNKIYLNIRSAYDKTIHGVTFKFSLPEYNGAVVISGNKAAVQSRWDSTNMDFIMWTDVMPGETEIVIEYGDVVNPN